MDIAITGSSGLIGSALTRSLTDDGHRVVPIVRSAAPGAVTRLRPSGRSEAFAVGGTSDDCAMRLWTTEIGRAHV